MVLCPPMQLTRKFSDSLGDTQLPPSFGYPPPGYFSYFCFSVVLPRVGYFNIVVAFYCVLNKLIILVSVGGVWPA